MDFAPSPPPARWQDRADAGRALAAELLPYAGAPGLLVLGLSRGGVPVAAEVARELAAPLDVVVVRKIGHPEQPELAAGAVAGIAGTVCVVRNEDVLRSWRRRDPAAEDLFAAAAGEQLAEVRRREELFRAGAPARSITGATVIAVDDGLATGATMRAALGAVRKLGPGLLVASAPVACGSIGGLLIPPADNVVVAWPDSGLEAVGLAYRRFGQTTDTEVRAQLGFQE